MKIKAPQKVDLTNMRAGQFLTKNHYRGQRPADPNRVKKLVAAIDDGTFHEARIAVAIVPAKDQEFLIDGQKCCLAVQETKKTVPATYIEIECAPNEVAKAFSLFDDHQPRSQGQRAWAFAVAAGLDRHFTRRSAGMIVSGLAQWKYWEQEGIWATEKCELLMTHRGVARKINDLAFKTGNECKHLQKPSVLAAMADSLVYDSEQARSFWDGVRTGAMLEANDARLKLRNFLMRAKIGGGSVRTTEPGQILTTGNQVLAVSLDHWNAWRWGVEPKLYRGTNLVVWSKDYDNQVADAVEGETKIKKMKA